MYLMRVRLADVHMEYVKTTIIRVFLNCKIAGMEHIYSSECSSPCHIPRGSCEEWKMNRVSGWPRLEFFS